MLDRDETAEKDAGDDIHALFHGAPKTTEFRKLRKRIIRDTREAIDRYGMVERRAPTRRGRSGSCACRAARTATRFWPR
jgi:hypothetical protein